MSIQVKHATLHPTHDAGGAHIERGNRQATADRKERRFTVLIVEPSRLIRQVISKVCAARGVTPRRRNEVGAALSDIAKDKPTGILTSLELPGFSGLALIAAIKSCPRHRAIPVGLLTSKTSVGGYPSGCEPDAIIHKDDRLMDSIATYLQRFGIGQNGMATSRQDGHARLDGRILLVEDSRCIQKLLGKFLHVAGAEVAVVENGEQAVTAAIEQSFDLILMDLEMPRMGGVEATKKIRAAGVTVPILASTAHDLNEGDAELRAVGFDGVLSKPVDRHTLVDTCASYLTRTTR